MIIRRSRGRFSPQSWEKMGNQGEQVLARRHWGEKVRAKKKKKWGDPVRRRRHCPMPTRDKLVNFAGSCPLDEHIFTRREILVEGVARRNSVSRSSVALRL